MNCEAETHVYSQHVFVLLSMRDAALFAQGRVAFGNFAFPPCRPIAHLQDPIESAFFEDTGKAPICA
jgi:hypothetical protein